PNAHDLCLRACNRGHAERRDACGAVAEHAAARMLDHDLPPLVVLLFLASRGSLPTTVDTPSEHIVAPRQKHFSLLHAAALTSADRRRAARPILRGPHSRPGNI